MKTIIAVILTVAVLCVLCGCTATRPNTTDTSARTDASANRTDSSANMSGGIMEPSSEIGGASTQNTDTNNTSTQDIDGGYAQTGESGTGPATLTSDYVTVQIPEGMDFSVENTGSDAEDGAFRVLLYGQDRVETRSFSVSENPAVTGMDDAVKECVRRHAGENNEVTYADDAEFSGVTYRAVHIVADDGSAADYLVTWQQAADEKNLYVEVLTAQYPTGSAVMPLEDPMMTYFLEGIRFTSRYGSRSSAR